MWCVSVIILLLALVSIKVSLRRLQKSLSYMAAAMIAINSIIDTNSTRILWHWWCIWIPCRKTSLPSQSIKFGGRRYSYWILEWECNKGLAKQSILSSWTRRLAQKWVGDRVRANMGLLLWSCKENPRIANCHFTSTMRRPNWDRDHIGKQSRGRERLAVGT